MKRFIYFFVIILGLFVLSFISRELISKQSSFYSDMACIYSEYEPSRKEELCNPAVLPYKYMHGGVVINSGQEFDHRNFYVGTYDGYVSVFNRYGSLCKITNILADNTPVQFRQILTKKIYFQNIEDAYSFIGEL